MLDKSLIRQILIDQREERSALLARCGVEREGEAAVVHGLSDDLIKVSRQFGNLPDEKLLVLTLDSTGTEHVDGRRIACVPVAGND